MATTAIKQSLDAMQAQTRGRGETDIMGIGGAWNARAGMLVAWLDRIGGA